MTIQVFSAAVTERLKYAVSFIFERYENIIVEYCHPDDAPIEGALSIQYGGDPGDSRGIYIPACGLLTETRVEQKWEAYFKSQTREEIFDGDENIAGFDALASVFYLISRYEEYLKHKRDEYDRYYSHNSLMYMKGWLQTPVVDLWIEEIVDRLRRIYKVNLSHITDYEFLSTIDIDFPWKSKHRKWPYSWIDALQPTGEGEDPYDTYIWIKHWHDEMGVKPTFFFMVNGKSQYDPVQKFKEHPYSNLIRHTDQWANVGIHPSYESYDHGKMIRKEKELLQKWLGREVVVSRQHYLRLKVPLTYQLLRTNGVKSDYSMGYAETIGFRAGTCHPFLWFDLEASKVTDLRIYPVHIMDVTLKKYLNKGPVRAFEISRGMIETCKRYRGTFNLIWHNSSLSAVDDWAEWAQTYKNLLACASN